MGGKRKERQQPTAEELIRKEDLKFKRLATKLAREWAEKDADVGRQMVAKVFGFKIPDQEEKSRSKLLAVIEERAIRKLEEDSQLADRVIDAYISKMIGDLGLVVEGGELRKKPSLQDQIRIAREVRELKEAMGIKDRGILNVFMNPEVIIALIGLLTAYFAQKQLAIQADKNVSAKEDGQEVTHLEGLIKLIARYNAKSPGEVKKVDPIDKGTDNTTPDKQDKSGKPREEDGKTGEATSGK